MRTLFSAVSELIDADKDALLSPALTSGVREPLFKGLAHVCGMLMDNPKLALSAEPINTLPDAWRNDTASTMLAKIINASTSTRKHTGGLPVSQEVLSFCDLAEGDFIEHFRLLKGLTEGNAWPANAGVRIVVDDNQQPVFIQKHGEHASTALNVAPVHITQTFEPGFIHRLDFKSTAQREPKPPLGQIEIAQMSELRSARVLRMSAFVLTAPEWKKWQTECFDYIEKPAPEFPALHMDDCRQIAINVMHTPGVLQ